jgi:hypothetical protein
MEYEDGAHPCQFARTLSPETAGRVTGAPIPPKNWSYPFVRTDVKRRR